MLSRHQRQTEHTFEVIFASGVADRQSPSRCSTAVATAPRATAPLAAYRLLEPASRPEAP